MKHIFEHKRISAILSILPPTIVRYEDELEDYPFPVRQSQMLGKMMDYNTRRQCEPGDSVSAYAIQGIQRVSSPGLRHYVDVAKLPRVRNGLGYAIISTSKGVMTDHEAREQKVGGEVIAKVW